MYKGFMKDVKAVFTKDPAAKNIFEVLLCYPGLHAIIIHRFAHFLYRLGIPLIPRLISHIVRFITGIEIHPGAKIGTGVVIDHGMGIVIGETAEIYDNVLIYQGVTLGGTGLKKGKRHPTIEENCIIGAGAAILGAITIGANSKIGAGSVVVKSAPKNSTVVGIPGRITRKGDIPLVKPEWEFLPDPNNYILNCLIERISELEKHFPDIEESQKKREQKCVFITDGAGDSAQCLT